MKEIEIYSPAKISLFYNVTGYNEEKQKYLIKSYNQTIDMYNIINIYERKKLFDGIRVIIDDNILNDLNNSAYIAANLFFKYTGINPNSFFIKIKKGIPNGYGFGGDDSNAASILVGLNEYYNTNLSQDELMFLASNIGYDVPYFINGGYSKIIGTGKKVIPIDENYYNHFVVVIPNFCNDEKEMFNKIDSQYFNKMKYLNNNLYNDFNFVMSEELMKLRYFLNNYPYLNHSLNGCGSSYFIALNKMSDSIQYISDIRKNFPNFKVRNYKKVKGRKLMKISKNYLYDR